MVTIIIISTTVFITITNLEEDMQQVIMYFMTIRSKIMINVSNMLDGYMPAAVGIVKNYIAANTAN